MYQKNEPMHKLFMVEFELPVYLTEDFIRQIPEHRRQTNELLADGIIKAYSLSMDRSKLWVVITATTEVDAMDQLLELPLTKYMTPDISELAFHNSEEMALHFSLN